jgi:GcrA cell cycle regulator
MTNSSFWQEHPEADPLMRKMFKEGCTMSQIGAAIGCSRNAVVGRVHRLGLKRFVPRATPQQPAPARAPRPKPPWVVGHARRQIIELRSDECHWPINEPGADFCFCAEPNLRGSSYCPYHHRLSYVPARGRQRP